MGEKYEREAGTTSGALRGNVVLHLHRFSMASSSLIFWEWFIFRHCKALASSQRVFLAPRPCTILIDGGTGQSVISGMSYTQIDIILVYQD
jgi:hypothetical protein